MPSITSHYVLKPGLTEEATGLFRTIETDTTFDIERFENGQWINDPGLFKYLIGEQDAELVDDEQAIEVERRLGGKVE